MKERLINWLNLALTANIFFVLCSFAWLILALLGKATGIPLGWELWYKLWEPVFTPAIGILMAGAIISGIVSWVAKRLNSDSTRSFGRSPLEFEKRQSER